MNYFPTPETYNLESQQDDKNHYQLHFRLTEALDKANIHNGEIHFYRSENRNIGDYSSGNIKSQNSSLDISFNFGQTKPDSFMRYPILYQRKKIGDLLVNKDENDTPPEIPEITKTIALIFKRFKTCESAEKLKYKNPTLIGFSDKSLKIESFIETASNTIAPVVIEAEAGNEVQAIALAIHNNSMRNNQRFVTVDCTITENLTQRINDAWAEAQGGSLYLHCINHLQKEEQHYLLRLLTPDVKLITSSTQDLETLVASTAFTQQLHNALGFLKIRIPPLSERKEDIPQMIEQLVTKYQTFENQILATNTHQELSNFNWPGNYEQLEQTIKTLLKTAQENPISIRDLEHIFPEIICARPFIKPRLNEQKIDIIPCLIHKEYQKLSGLHLALRKSLQFLAENYSSAITLDSLSQKAHVSASHLSFLFKFHLNKSFKKVLAELRVEHAKSLFAESPYTRVTDVCLEVGFGDLSHFEKIFKRHTDLTPRAYKESIHKKCFF